MPIATCPNPKCRSLNVYEEKYPYCANCYIALKHPLAWLMPVGLISVIGLLVGGVIWVAVSSWS